MLKKPITLLLAVLMNCLLTACGNSSQEGSIATTDNASVQEENITAEGNTSAQEERSV